MLSDTNIWDVDDNNKDDHCHPSMSILEEYIEGAVAAPFSEKCKCQLIDTMALSKDFLIVSYISLYIL